MKAIEITNVIKIIDLALLVNDVLIFADFHIGYEEALTKQGVLVPRFQFKDTMNRLENIFDFLEKEKIKIKTVVINGDLKHEFGQISMQEWREALKVFDFLAERCSKIVLIKGNHDTILGPIAEKRNLDVVDEFLVDSDGKTILVMHGHKLCETLNFNKSDTLIIAHEHPAVSLRESPGAVRVEKYKCFLKGKYKGKTLIVQPSFCLVTEGTDVMKEVLLSPYLQQSLDEFDCWVVSDEEVLHFGKLKNIE
ncbi:metallophosphoesterase [Candidatus Woesearchaeota archaeon]|nr:metallophosphoesterase [Candidatus Woesearchaeota archaeon]MBW3017855.1 metallophosphoesterase [Candidatus Woesearchaeota archaeon]